MTNNDNGLNCINFFDLVSSEGASHDSLLFILSCLKSYSLKEPLFFSYERAIKNIFVGSEWLFLVREGMVNKYIFILDVQETERGNEILRLKLLVGQFGKNKVHNIDYISNILTAIAKEKNIPYISIDARAGWKKYLKHHDIIERATTYVKKVG